MFVQTLSPRFSETDGLGHINNTVIPVWFESARTPIFKVFNPSLDLAKWNLIIAKIEVNYVAQMDYQLDVEIRTYISHLGKSSLTVLQVAYQKGRKVAWGEAVMVKFDYSLQASVPMTELELTVLAEHAVDKQVALAD